MKTEIISIGSELTSGRNLDTNSQWLSRRLAEIGVPVGWHTTVADDLEAGGTGDIDILDIGVEIIPRVALVADQHLVDAAIRCLVHGVVDIARLVVEEGALRFHMTNLRKALGEGGDGNRYIATSSGRGYTFVAQISRSVGQEPEVIAALGARMTLPGMP